MSNNNTIYLPELIKIKVKNFTLYEAEPSFEYEFIKGVNLIIGGNGVGKTTFLNLIKFALIGLYKKELFTKIYMLERTDKRINISYDYFKNRFKTIPAETKESYVELTFKLNTTIITVKRDLFNPMLSKFSVETNGKIESYQDNAITQKEYDLLMQKKTKEVNKKQEYSSYLQGRYEQIFEEKSNFKYFDSAIFIINELLFFGESRKTILWEDENEENSIQYKITSNYFIEPTLNHDKNNSERNAKYYDSSARHYSEEMKAVNRVLENIEKNSETNNANNKHTELLKISKDLETEENNQEKIIKLRSDTEYLLKTLKSKRATLLNTQAEKIDESKKIISNNYVAIFKDKNHKYNAYEKMLVVECKCPMCTNELSDINYKKFSELNGRCFLCNEQINEKTTELRDENFNKELSNLKNEIDLIESEIIENEKSIKKLDRDFQDKETIIQKIRSRKRTIEYELSVLEKNLSNTNSTREYSAIKLRLNDLENKKLKAQSNRDIEINKIKSLNESITNQLLNARESLSSNFNKYASEFLGVTCELVYDTANYQYKKYFPRIDKVNRMNEEELSESQRFFMDQSFRMALIDYFHTNPTFFMCETPDSSLDVSYEQNAAKVFIKFLERPNILIITSNLNSSKFLKNIIEFSPSSKILDLLSKSSKSKVQSESNELSEALTAVLNLKNINEKQ